MGQTNRPDMGEPYPDNEPPRDDLSSFPPVLQRIADDIVRNAAGQVNVGQNRHILDMTLSGNGPSTEKIKIEFSPDDVRAPRILDAVKGNSVKSINQRFSQWNFTNNGQKKADTKSGKFVYNIHANATGTTHNLPPGHANRADHEYTTIYVEVYGGVVDEVTEDGYYKFRETSHEGKGFGDRSTEKQLSHVQLLCFDDETTERSGPNEPLRCKSHHPKAGSAIDLQQREFFHWNDAQCVVDEVLPESLDSLFLAKQALFDHQQAKLRSAIDDAIAYRAPTDHVFVQPTLQVSWNPRNEDGDVLLMQKRQQIAQANESRRQKDAAAKSSGTLARNENPTTRVYSGYTSSVGDRIKYGDMFYPPDYYVREKALSQIAVRRENFQYGAADTRSLPGEQIGRGRKRERDESQERNRTPNYGRGNEYPPRMQEQQQQLPRRPLAALPSDFQNRRVHLARRAPHVVDTTVSSVADYLDDFDYKSKAASQQGDGRDWNDQYDENGARSPKRRRRDSYRPRNQNNVGRGQKARQRAGMESERF